MTRFASGKKKKYMITKHATTERTSTHRIKAISNFKCMKYPIISADLMIDSSSRTSSIRTGENTCLYPSTTSIAVSTSRAPQTQKYCPLASSCFATSCIRESSVCLCVPCGEFVLGNLSRHQIHQREDKHPHQINKVPVQPANLHIVRVVILRLEKPND